MNPYGVNDLRRMFLDFFKEKEHLLQRSYSLIPHNDNSLLLINSGMAPMKPFFTGQETPPKKRMTSCQKCLRTGDLEHVGKTARHGTFFEMLGNFSFGDYFKEEAIAWAWEFLTETVGLAPERLYPSVYEKDEEAYAIWRDRMHIPEERIFRFGKEDNFWEHGAGPCGPCSEIYYDRGEKYGTGPQDVMGGEGDRFMEVWNIVFSQFENDGKGHYTELSQKNIDTGMGLERLAVAVQDVGSIFDIDTLYALRSRICAMAGDIGYEAPGTETTDVSVRIVTDHVRAMTFLVSDGVMPSNNGRGYVLRRLIRRALRHGRKLSIEGSFLPLLAENVIGTSADGYPELLEKKEFILSVIRTEEENFERTYEQGLRILTELEEGLLQKKETVLSGEDAFKLYDTYGFPLDNTVDILAEKGFTVDEAGFLKAMERQKKAGRKDREASGKNKDYIGAETTVYENLAPEVSSEFIGYDTLRASSEILALVVLGEEEEIVPVLSDGQAGAIITQKTPFYATMGGQVGDTGTISGDGAVFTVERTEHVAGGGIAHIGRVDSGLFRLKDTVSLEVDEANRHATCQNHSATHLLHRALREVLGSHVEQAGSYQDAERTRFDFSHFHAMTPEELSRVEGLVRERIAADVPVTTRVMGLEEAKKTGAMALFGEKYGDSVRVVEMGPYSTELCGGTHVPDTGKISAFKILSENGVAAGVRRIEAITGPHVTAYYENLEKEITEAAAALKATPATLLHQIQKLQEEAKSLRAENESLKAREAGEAAGALLEGREEVNGVSLIAERLGNTPANELRTLGDSLKEKLPNAMIVLASETNGKVNLMATATAPAVAAGAHAGNLIREIAALVGGGGGGKAAMAQAGGKNPAGIEAALAKAKEVLKAQLCGQ